MFTADIKKHSVNNLTYVYDLSLTLSNISAELSPHPESYATANKIKATISSYFIDGGLPAQNVDIILQINPPASVLTVYNEDHAFIKSYEEGRYHLKTGADGKVIVYFASASNTCESIQLIAKENGSSVSTQHIMFFGDYAPAPTLIPPPVFDLDGNGQVDIPTDSPYFHVTIPPQKPAVAPTGLSCIAITNTTHFTKQSYS